MKNATTLSKTAKQKLIRDLWKNPVTKTALLDASLAGEGTVTHNGKTYTIRSIFKNS